MRVAAWLGWALLCSACQTAPAQVPRDALLSETSTETHALLMRTASELLGGTPVLLADDAFLNSSRITIERAPRRDAAGLRIEGRDPGMPKVLRLQIAEGACWLHYEGSGERRALPGLACRVQP